jgi:galactitol-specific phosphotransferase system IIB component
MGIGSNLMVELQEQEIEEQNYQNIVDEAAHYVVNEKMSREEAFAKAKNLHEQRQDKDNYVVIDEETMEVEYLQSDLKEPVFQKTKQLEAVSSELFTQFE